MNTGFGSGTSAFGAKASAFGSGTSAFGAKASAFGSGTSALGAKAGRFGSGTSALGAKAGRFGSGTSAFGTSKREKNVEKEKNTLVRKYENKTYQFALNSKYLANISRFANGNKNFCSQCNSFIINNEYKIELPSVVAVTLSSKLTDLLEIDRTADSLMINIKSKTNITGTLDKIKRIILNNEEVTISDDEIPVFTTFGLEIGNEDFLKPAFEQIKRVGETMNEESVVELIKKKQVLHVNDFSKEVDFIAKNFSTMIEKDSFIEFANNFDNIDIVEQIISNKKLKLDAEDCLLGFIMLLSEYNDNDTRFFQLFRYVYLEYCSLSKCTEFLDFVKEALHNQEISSVLSCISRRLLQPKLPMNEIIVEGRHRNASKFNSNAGKYNGIISHLSEAYGGNVYQKNVIGIESSSNYDDSSCSKLENVVQESGDWGTSDNDEDSWILFDFKKKKVAVNGYTMRSNSSAWGDYTRSWVLEGSNNKNVWKVIDKQNDQKCMAGDYNDHLYNCPLSQYYRYLRIKRVGKSWKGSNYLILNRIEFFGNFIE